MGFVVHVDVLPPEIPHFLDFCVEIDVHAGLRFVAGFGAFALIFAVVVFGDSFSLDVGGVAG